MSKIIPRIESKLAIRLDNGEFINVGLLTKLRLQRRFGGYKDLMIEGVFDAGDLGQRALQAVGTRVEFKLASPEEFGSSVIEPQFFARLISFGSVIGPKSVRKTFGVELEDRYCLSAVTFEAHIQVAQ